jgi:P-type E1-E2 ATPase
MSMSSISLPADSEVGQQESLGRTIIYIAIGTELAGMFIVGDQLRSDAVEVLRQLELDGNKLCIVSGDNWKTTRAISDMAGITEFHAQKSPFEKAEIISVKQELGESVCFVGDGINDSPAMGLSTVSIAMGTATDLTANSADIVLLKPSLTNVRTAISTCESIRRKVIINFACAASYNIVAIPLASGILLKYGIYVSPTYSGIFMAMSSLLVLINSMLL